MKMEMSESTARFIDSICKLLTVLALTVGGTWTLIAYLAHLAEVALTNQVEASKPYRSARLELYAQVTDLVGQIVASNNPEAAKRATEQLSILYHGKARLFAERSVQRAWTDFDVCQAGGFDECPKNLNKFAVLLGATCRDSIAKEWDIQMPEDDLTIQRLRVSRP